MQRETIEGLNITNIISDAIRVDDGQHCRSMARADGVWDALNRAGYEIVRKPQTAQQVHFSVRIGWPAFTSHTVEAPEGSDVATVTRAAKALANDREGGGARRSRWLAFSLVECRFLAPDEPAPDRLVVGPYEDLVREVRPPEASEMTGSDRERYERRWETGLRNIVTILHGPRYSFEIGSIVEEVRALKDGRSSDDNPWKADFEGVVEALRRTGQTIEIRDVVQEVEYLRDIVSPLTASGEGSRRTEHFSFEEDEEFTTISGLASTVERILDLIGKGQDVEARAGAPSSNGDVILATFSADGILTFTGDAKDMAAFRDMAAKVAGMPSLEATA